MIGEHLRRLRKARGLTQQQLGKELGISASAVGMYEQGRRAPDHKTLSDLCRYFQVSSDYFLLEQKDGEEAELDQLIAQFQARLMSQEGLMFNGEPLSRKEVAQVVEAIQMGTRIAMERLARGKDAQNNGM